MRALETQTGLTGFIHTCKKVKKTVYVTSNK